MTLSRTSTARPVATWRGLGLGLAGMFVATTAMAAQPTGEPVKPVQQVQVTAAAAYDPWESINRRLFAFGMGVDHTVIGPVTHGYMKVAPQPVRDRVSAVVYNLGEPSTALEDLLQLHPKLAGVTTARFVINSTVGFLGMFDVASHWGLGGHGSDFGQTLGRYGAHPGPYIYVPVVGPLNLRDGVGRVVDVVTDPVGFVTGPITSTAGGIRYSGTALDQRALADPAFQALDDATDPYATTRSAYSQYRAAVVEASTGVVQVQALPDFDDEPSQP